MFDDASNESSSSSSSSKLARKESRVALDAALYHFGRDDRPDGESAAAALLAELGASCLGRRRPQRPPSAARGALFPPVDGALYETCETGIEANRHGTWHRASLVVKRRDDEATWHEAAVAFSNDWELVAGSGCSFVDGTSCASNLLVDRLRAECNSSGTRLPITRLMDDPSFPSIADAYASNVPFPHAAFDGFDVVGDDAALDGLAGEFPRVGEKAAGWASRIYEVAGNMGNKRFASNEELMGPKAFEALRIMKSSNFVTFLERLTNITGLLIDPHNVGAGLHQSLHGGFLEAHTDFNLLEPQNAYRRINVFLFLNHDWRPEFGGQLELFDQTFDGFSRAYVPKMGRLLVFSSSCATFHGHPKKLDLPDGRARNSIAMYYYTTAPPPDANCTTEATATIYAQKRRRRATALAHLGDRDTTPI